MPELGDILESTVQAMAFEFVGWEMQSQGRRGLLRVYIDSDKGVTSDDCARVSRQLSAVLEVEDLMSGHYDLEVSSPGLDRPLFTVAQYQQFIGKRVRIQLRKPQSGQRYFNGVLQTANTDSITIACEEKEVELPFDEIKKANLIPEI